ncbi:glycoside hydrolase family 3 N-terminal domain-containing protein [Saccharicrinis aurantiacus]|uniref:glycoside hydrolase family 3 N-terminal domain-containing protein n=1 Tax=Saccharicrinis aurantiacus TaxID=1849719 RepID=UPI0024905701|nr:glycoside hydrolase family 3 N-terminal domain-containing protein [Saccharicrinis aurantiacus]
MKNLLLLITIVLLAVSCTTSTKSNEKLFEKEVDQLLAKMTLDEKVAQMRIFHANKGIELDENDNLVLSDYVKERLKLGAAGIKNPGEHYSPERSAKLNNLLQKYIIENNRLGIPSMFITESYNGVDAEGTTRFERPISLASTWNKDMVYQVYNVMGQEARMRGLHMTHSPVADIARDPRFGRMGEGFGEDTHLVSEMMVSAVKGLQGNFTGLSSTHIGAVTKHFAGYAQVQGGKNFASMEISPRTLIDEIFPPFKAAIQRANTLGIMASHADINGVASHANKWLLTDILRDQWGFEGYTVSDANDIGRLHYFMKVAETPEAAAEIGLKAGMDVDLYADDAYALLPKMVESNPELEKYIDRSVKRVLRTKFILGLFDNPYADVAKAKNETRNAEATQLAHDADLESIILLKNEKSTLPLKQNAKAKIALVGPVLSPASIEAFKKVAGSDYSFVAEKGYALTNGVKGAPTLTSEKDCKKGISKITRVARNADVIVLFAGGDEFTSKEAFFNNAIGDRDCIDPVSHQDELLLELKKLNKPIIVVLKHRRTLAINAISENANAILDCWELSEFGDEALAKTIFGYSVPSAKLPVTVPRNIGQLPFHYSQKEINYKKSYLFSDITPLYPFGFGLSYTTFEYLNLQLSDNKLTDHSTIKASIEITNKGTVKAKEVVQLYLKDLIGSVVRPVQELKGFQKIELNPGETKKVTFEISIDDVAFTGADMEFKAEKGDFELRIGSSCASYESASFYYE